MTITALTDLSKLPNQSQDQATFDANWAYVLETMVLRANQENALAAIMSSAGSGSAFSLQYKFDAGTATTDPTAGWMRLATATQNLANAVVLDEIGADGVNNSVILDLFDSSTSTIKGHLLLRNAADPSKWLLLAVTGRAATTGYRTFYTTPVASSVANPFAQAGLVVVSFSRTGDKGDTGAAADLKAPTIYVRDEKSVGTTGGLFTNAGSTPNVRVLNAVKRNDISGASLAANRVTVPAGTYNVFARAPAYNTTAHRIALWNVTANSLFEIGTSEYAGSVQTDSIIQTRNTVLSVATTFELQHFVSASGGSHGQGYPSGLVYNEVYAELTFEKVA
ncbi:hypothetical protein IM543_11185 [Massilia sp. UMI-21]|nr:hypothetical protein IM543_11185 [Massilia sp. UMI-21]